MKRVFLAGIALTALAGAAAAADLPPGPAPYYKAPTYAPAYNWTGFYLGVNGGGGFGTSAWSSTGSFNLIGALAGGTIGYNYQTGPVVLGVEGDIDWSGMSGSTTASCAAGCKTSDNWLSTVRGRLGYAADRFLPYVTGGAAVGDIQAARPAFAGGSTSNLGWTVGAGIEFALAGRWTAKAEYLYVDLGNFNCGLGCGVAAVNRVSFTDNILRGGFDYRF
ncbi:MAG TPA: outer membrane protein [Xanthobacteraceae bacterium]|nr:outer membrane protein [Xanthobacteraceae bacterium]